MNTLNHFNSHFIGLPVSVAGPSKVSTNSCETAHVPDQIYLSQLVGPLSVYKRFLQPRCMSNS